MVDGAVAVARRLNVPDLVIGLTPVRGFLALYPACTIYWYNLSCYERIAGTVVFTHPAI